jgi:RNA polymerase sigma-70 factor (ECF subfamily)
MCSVDPTRLHDRELVLAARQGDRNAFGQLVERYRRGVVRVVERMCGDPQLAEEAAQEAFVRAWQRLHTYRPEFPFRNWIYAIATNLAVDRLRREPKTAELEAARPQVAGRGLEEQVETQERAGRVRQSILALPAASRAVLILREYEGLSYQEISATLGIPIGTVMSRLNYARSRLRERLAAELEP